MLLFRQDYYWRVCITRIATQLCCHQLSKIQLSHASTDWRARLSSPGHCRGPVHARRIVLCLCRQGDSRGRLTFPCYYLCIYTRATFCRDNTALRRLRAWVLPTYDGGKAEASADEPEASLRFPPRGRMSSTATLVNFRKPFRALKCAPRAFRCLWVKQPSTLVR